MIKESDYGCELCYSTNDETKQILTALLQSLFKTDGRTKFDEGTIIDNGGFLGLLKMLFGTKYKNFKETMKCSHLRLRNAFESTLEISAQDLNSLSNIKMIEKAKFLYHLDIAGVQVKTFPRHLPSIDQKIILSQKVKGSFKSPVRTEKTISPPKKAVENSQGKQELVKNEDGDKNNPIVYPMGTMGQINYGQGIQFGSQFNQMFNNMFLMAFNSASQKQG